ncbi:MAG: DNA repair protein RadA, partial [Clostridium sp.]|nr:DNA repair protein RadA [Clostridium sp.]
MAKAKTTTFFCSECGYESAKWMGQCPACKAWNTMVEEPVAPKTPGRGISQESRRAAAERKPVTLDEITLDEEDRIGTGFEELDRVLGSGIVKGSMVLVGGDPGIGKSTILLQVCR